MEDKVALMGLLSSIEYCLSYKEGYKWVVDFRHALVPDMQELMEKTEELIACSNEEEVSGVC